MKNNHWKFRNIKIKIIQQLDANSVDFEARMDLTFLSNNKTIAATNAEWINMILIKLHHTHTHSWDTSVFNQLTQVKYGDSQEDVVNLSGRNSFYFSFALLIFYFILVYKNLVARITGIQNIYSEMTVLAYRFEAAVKPEGIK